MEAVRVIRRQLGGRYGSDTESVALYGLFCTTTSMRYAVRGTHNYVPIRSQRVKEA